MRTISRELMPSIIAPIIMSVPPNMAQHMQDSPLR